MVLKCFVMVVVITSDNGNSLSRDFYLWLQILQPFADFLFMQLVCFIFEFVTFS
jgi:hypothetical protein